ASVELVAGGASRTAAQCRDALLALIKGRQGVPEQTLTMSGENPRYESFVADFQGKPVNQKHIHEVYFRDEVCAQLHLSKVRYTTADDAGFEAIFKSARFEPIGADGLVTRTFLAGRGQVAVLGAPARWGFQREEPRNGMPLGLFLLVP